jgi:hypothetical protein
MSKKTETNVASDGGPEACGRSLSGVFRIQMGRSGGIGATVSVRGFSRPWGGSWVDSKDDPAVRRASLM